jgi:putative AdoMet-dependent methyltransferase
MTDHFPASNFDFWASSYDQDCLINKFPFEGYSLLLKTIFELSETKPENAVLDLGIGTGNLALLFANAGCALWGLDFSPKMLALAQMKVPHAVLALADLHAEWPPVFQRRFDCVVSAYTFHHFSLQEKLSLVQRILHNFLTPNGRLIIGDIAFHDAADEEVIRQKTGDEWEEEYYWLVDETFSLFHKNKIFTKFIKISTCSGIFVFDSAPD